MYTGIFAAFLAAAGYLFISPYLNKEPTCTDGRMNGDETGVDCGGMCARVCSFEADKISVLWSRTFRVVSGRYNAVAYLENYNRGAAVRSIGYRFRFYDKDNLYIGKRDGQTFIPPGGKFVVFEAAVNLGSSVPVFTIFEFTEAPQWFAAPAERLRERRITVSNVNFVNQDTSPRLYATLRNNSLFSVSEVGAVVLLRDDKGNVVNVSRTYLEEMKGEEEKEIVFTWPEPMTENIVEKEIIPIYDIFSIKLL